MLPCLFIISIFIFSFSPLAAQDSLQQIPIDYLGNVTAKTNQVEQKLDKKADKVFDQMRKLEEKMKRKLLRIDSLKARELFGNPEERYRNFEEGLKNNLSGKQYIPALDTLSTSLKFLQQNPRLIAQLKDGGQKVKDALGKIDGLREKFRKGEEIKKFLKKRKQVLQDQLAQLGFAKELKKINKQVYYYSEQLNEYKAMLKDHKKAERKVIGLLSKTKLFKYFMRRNSMLASLFRIPDNPYDPLAQASLSGLQTRAQVNNLIQQQIVIGGANAQNQFRQNIESAQSQINQLKNKISQSANGNSDDMIPEGFKPNGQKTKSFLKRLEFGANTQTQKAGNFFPVTSDLGLSLGYKLNDRSIVGIGASYKLGWGRGWKHIKFSGEGAGLRSFIDWKMKGNLWISGGYEMNYKTAFNNIDVLRDMNAWQQSGLLGLSKTVSVRSKFFKKTKLQLLWDFLSYQQKPMTQPVVFRVGYNLK